MPSDFLELRAIEFRPQLRFWSGLLNPGLKKPPRWLFISYLFSVAHLLILCTLWECIYPSGKIESENLHRAKLRVEFGPFQIERGGCTGIFDVNFCLFWWDLQSVSWPWYFLGRSSFSLNSNPAFVFILDSSGWINLGLVCVLKLIWARLISCCLLGSSSPIPSCVRNLRGYRGGVED